MPIEDTTPHISSQYLEVPELESPGHHIVAQLRKVTSSPSPLTLLLQDPAVLELSRSKRKDRTKSRSPHRGGRSPSIMALALVEEERQASQLKAHLRNASDRIEHEIRRAEEAEGRAEYAEQRAIEMARRVVAAETAKQQVEASLERSKLENKMQLESTEKELKRLKAEVLGLKQDNEELEGSNIKAKETSRHYQKALRDYQAREEGRAEARQEAMIRYFDEGHEEGWSKGHEEGFEEGMDEGYEAGRKAGRKEGLREGIEKGRNEERRNALEAFDRFLNEEMDGQGDRRSERIRRWTESVYYPGSVSVPDSPS